MCCTSSLNSARRYLNSLLFIVTIALIGVMLSGKAMAASETLEFETQGLDLDTVVPRKYSSETNIHNNLSAGDRFAYFFLDFRG